MNPLKARYEILTADTPNGVKIPIALEELALDYRLRLIDLDAGEQKLPDFLALNPNGRIPVLLDTASESAAPTPIMESGAILLVLAQRHSGLLPDDPSERIACLEYLFFQVASIGPIFGQAGWFARSAPEQTVALQRFREEAERLVGVLEARLTEHEWLAGGSYSIADIAHFGWLRVADYAGIDLKRFPFVQRWVRTIARRPAVRRAVQRLRSSGEPAVCAI